MLRNIFSKDNQFYNQLCSSSFNSMMMIVLQLNFTCMTIYCYSTWQLLVV